MNLPALADVLACLTEEGSAEWWRAFLSDQQVRICAGRVEVFAESHDRWCRLRAWRFGDAAEALEALEAAGLAPEDDGRRQWAHFVCYECGLRRAPAPPRICPRCSSSERLTRPSKSPLDVASLAVVASLGVPGWRRAEELARVVEHDAAVAWRIDRPGLAHVAALRLGVGDLHGLGVHVAAVGPGSVTLAAEGATC